MKFLGRRGLQAALAGVALSAALATVAAPAQAAQLRHPPKPVPAPTSTPAPAPAPTSSPAIAVTGPVTRLGSTFSEGGYSLRTYTIDVAAGGTYAVQYSTGFGGARLNTYVDGTLAFRSTGAGTDGTGLTPAFALSAGRHTIGTESPDGYGQIDLDLVRR